MENVVYGWHIREKHRVQHKSAGRDDDNPLLHEGDVVSTEDMQLFPNIRELLHRGRWGSVAILHTPPRHFGQKKPDRRKRDRDALRHIAPLHNRPL